MRIALIGLGDIARKAYLPILTSRAGLDLHLVTRDESVLQELGDQYRIAGRHSRVDSALEERLDAAFVHAATSAHPALVEQLLEAGVPTYVDKPLATDAATCERLVRLSEARGCSLFVGFNRRFAPLYAELQTHPRDIILMQKNRASLPDAPRNAIFDDYIHVADTLLSLLPGPALRTSVDFRVEGGQLHHIALTLSGECFSAFGIMNRMSGADEETLEVSGGGRKRRVVNLAEVIDHGGPDRVTRRPDWRSATWMRGLDQTCDHFLAAVHAGEYLSPREALATHLLCEEITREVEASLRS